jgi:hypothetical protein
MANFGSRLMGFFSSVGGGGGGGQNLQMTLNNGFVTTNNINLLNGFNINRSINYTPFNIEVTNDVNQQYFSQSGTSTSISSTPTQTSITETQLTITNATNGNDFNFQNGANDTYLIPKGYSDPTTHPIPTLAVSQMIYVADINIDGTTYQIASTGNEIRYNCFFSVSRANGTINFNSVNIAEDVPFYLCVSDGGDYTLTFTSDISIVTQANPLSNQLGLFTCIKQRSGEGEAYKLFIQ